MRERTIEQYLREQTQKMGGRAYKWVSPGNDGVPDRIVLLPEARILFCEMKAPGKKPTALQTLQMQLIAKLGFNVCTVDSKEHVDLVLTEVSPWLH